MLQAYALKDLLRTPWKYSNGVTIESDTQFIAHFRFAWEEE